MVGVIAQSSASGDGVIASAAEQLVVPEAEWLVFPPFPAAPSGVTLIPFSSYTNPGVYVVDGTGGDDEGKSGSDFSTDDQSDDAEGVEPVEHDANDVPLVTLGIAHDAASKDVRAKARWQARSLKKRSIWRLEYDECWLIGNPESDWEEPERTSQSVYDLSSPPFTRLLTATRDFISSRHAAFCNPANKLLFDSLRSALNIRSEFPGQHWPAPVFEQESELGHAEDQDGEDFAPIPEEICIFLREPATSIRGFLALARKEAEAIWALDRALTLASITSAFLSYLHHYNVLPDPKINPGFLEALAIARGARAALVNADKLEQGLNDVKGFNMLAWSMWARAEEMGNVDAVLEKMQVTKLEDADGWDVTAKEAGPPPGAGVPELLTVARATPLITTLFYPTPPSTLKLLHQIPYGRRIVTAVLAPLTCLPPKAPHYQSKLYRLITAPAPWTPEEKWRQRRPRTAVDAEELDDGAEDVVLEAPDVGPLELTIWVERSAMADLNAGTANALVGMGLRGAWSLVGDGDGHDVWLFRAKDFILPSYWQSKQATAETARELASASASI